MKNEGVSAMPQTLEYKGYHASVVFDAEDEIFVGEVFGISDSLNFHGTSTKEIKEMFHQSIDNYLELCEKIGKNPEKEYKGTFNVRISPELHKKAALHAAEQNITLNQFVTDAIRESLEKKQIIERENADTYDKEIIAWFIRSDVACYGI